MIYRHQGSRRIWSSAQYRYRRYTKQRSRRNDLAAIKRQKYKPIRKPIWRTRVKRYNCTNSFYKFPCQKRNQPNNKTSYLPNSLMIFEPVLRIWKNDMKMILNGTKSASRMGNLSALKRAAKMSRRIPLTDLSAPSSLPELINKLSINQRLYGS